MTRKAPVVVLALTACIVAAGMLVGPLSSQPVTGQDAASYVGSAKCKSCHKEQHVAWGEMKHAHAFDVLSAEQIASGKDEQGRTCVQCHTTGYGKGGFTTAEETPKLKNVGCESCHGAASIHVKTMLTAMLEDDAEVTEKHISKGSGCAACHNPHISYKKLYGK